ncbi:MAG TPA: tetratricopeptide repeat protein [Myxococcota bacterium]|nr:tetratricopeptide repeat protein [Myxococcota bacterium]
MSDAITPGGLNPGELDEDVRDDFLYHFYRGSEMLSCGRLEEAREHLEKAGELKPDNSRCQNLLGLVYLKLSNFEQSIAIYRGLVERFPEEETLRVNLASVYIRAGKLAQAESELVVALGLRPDYTKAHKTLAVALLRRGDVSGAREHLRAAGVEDDDLPGMADGNGVLEQELPEPDSCQDPAGFKAQEEPHAPDGSFGMEGDCLTAQSPVCARLDGLLWIVGDLSFTSMRKRFSRQETRYPFGKGGRAMVLVEGEGRLLFSPRADGYFIYSQESGSGFFNEEHVIAFDSIQGWENGRLKSGAGAELNVFHVQGPAQVVLGGGQAIRSREIPEDGKFLIAARGLVGWTESPATRLIEAQAPLPRGPWIEFDGHGQVIYMVES